MIFAALLRLWKLGVVPAGVTHDEIGYIYNAYSIAKTGKNVFGEFLPFLTWVNAVGFPFLPVPIYLSAPLFLFFDISATVGRLPSALLGILDISLIYILVKQLFGKNSLATLSAFFLAISPWHLHFSRSAYDPNFALFFYLLGIVVFIWEVKKKRIPILSPVALLFAVFSYRGMNPIFAPLGFLLLWYGAKILRATKKQLIAFLFGIFLIGTFLLSVILVHGRSYLTAEGSVFNQPKMQKELDTQIRESQGPLFLRRVFLNKPMYLIYTLRANYLRAYSPEFLFLYTEPNSIYSIWSRGRIFFLDIIFIILGLVYIFKLNKNSAIFMTVLILFAGLPGMIGGMPYSARNFLLSALLPILSAGGIVFLLDSVSQKIKILLITVLVLSYSYVLGSYLFDYYGRYALYGSEAWAKSLKEMSALIKRERDDYDRIIVAQAGLGDFLQYAFYSKANPSRIQKSLQDSSSNGGLPVSLNNVSFISECLSDGEGNLPQFTTYKSVIYFVRDDCVRFATPSGAIRDYHGNTVWKFYRINNE